MRTTASSGRISGRKESEWGQMGVTSMAGVVGAIMLPPALME
jgi:hypothetical protein